MKLWRRHICKLSVLLLVLTGYSLHLAQPFSSTQHSHAFTRWLESVVKKENASEVRQQLQDLHTYSGELSPLIHKASKIVHENNEDFRLPVDKQANSPSDVYHLLVKEWNQYQSGESMQPLAFPTPDTKILSVFPRISSTFSYANSLYNWNISLSCQEFTLIHIIPNPFRIDAIPLIGGTAIGAP